MGKSFFSTVILSLLLIFCYNYREDIVNFVMKKVDSNITATLPEANDYEKNIINHHPFSHCRILRQQMRIYRRTVQDSRLPSGYEDKRDLPG